MSKKLKRKKQSKQLWFWLLGGVLLIATGFFLLMQGRENEPEMPILKVEPERIDYGNVNSTHQSLLRSQ